jgi:peptidoglycan glycosyltransferase
MISSIRHVSRFFLISFAVVALALGYWGLVRQDELLMRPDNPRRIASERRIQRGQIVDRNGIELAQTLVDNISGVATRYYPYAAGTAHVVGYYSLQYGVSGIEAQYDALLRGDSVLKPSQRLFNALLHRPQVGGDVQLTLDIAIQQAAEHALEGQKGAIVVLSVPQGEVLAMSSQPTFDPNMLGDNWPNLRDDPSAPLLNRATQGLYQPGTILQSVLLGAALNANLPAFEISWEGELSSHVNGRVLPCAAEPSLVDSVATAYLWGCPAPFQPLVAQIGARRLGATLTDFGLLEAPDFVLPSAVSSGLGIPPAEDDLLLVAIGQGMPTVSPLQMALVAAAFADHGRIPVPQLVLATREPESDWQSIEPEGNPRGAISRSSADAVAQLMARSVTEGAARAASLPGSIVYGHAGLALASPQPTYNVWFIGFTYYSPDQAIAIAVLLEDTTDTSMAAWIGGQVLQVALGSFPQH